MESVTMLRRLLIVLVVAMLVLPASAMADRYAAPAGSGEVSGCTDKANPCGLEKALSLATKNDTVWLAEGTYKPAGELVVPEEFVTVSGEPGQALPVIEAKGATGINAEETSVTLRDLRIHSTAATAVGMRLSFGSTAERVESSGAPQMACMLGTSNLRNTLCATSAGRGIYTSYSVPVGLPSLLIKLNNVTAAGSVVGIEMTAGNQAAISVYAKNTIAVGATSIITRSTNPGGAGIGIFLSHSTFPTYEALNETGITSNTAEGNQATPPVFVDAAAADYREQATSPTRLAGTLQELAGPTDLAGQPRTRACDGVTQVDIGAYQFQEACPPPSEPETPVVPVTPEEESKKPDAPSGSGSGSSGGSGTGTQTAAPSPPPTPRLSGLSLKPRRFAKRTTIAFNLSAPASVQLEVLARKAIKGKKPKLVRVRRLTAAGTAGANKVSFAAGALKPGTYTLRASVAGSSVTARFTIAAP
jgi:hypothetical protein